ncbi:hypothetical protein SMACR_12819 [Sordaria macrospora]|uniref:WGS project CABT00000000 data, contig 2.75 n=2 Tax=Sordaria macrospora TaxID=5147 RepID=F7WBG5_SORMK|nr:uncharacterized protein SMAC_12819 [Sordaria macrospora k-hell]KAA8628538.1 hypothetical protein SMACR_12819 [Sordaria macrospora]WPJ65130.1 hypothetical protein SMAC4_12819 [Sordaria macrospora]CCC05437.1 unnamed protein product [Sordaria macrospora k-hell]
MSSPHRRDDVDPNRRRARASVPAPTPTTFLLDRNRNPKKRASPTLSEPDSLITPPASVTSSIATRYSKVINQANMATRGAASGFQIMVDFNRGLWGFCGEKEQIVGNCALSGVCYDEESCKDGCGDLSRKDLRVARCSRADASGSTTGPSICATAYLTLDNNLGPFQYVACGWTTTKAHYTASQADAALNPFLTTTSSSSSAPSSGSSPTVLSPASSSTLLPSASTLANPSQTITTMANPLSTDSQDSLSGSSGSGGSNSNIGAIVGGVIGGLAVICAFAFAAYLVWVYRIRDRRKQGTHASQPLNGNSDDSGRSSNNGSPSPPSNNLQHVPLTYSPNGQPQQYGSGSGLGLGQLPPSNANEYGIPFVPMTEMEQRRRIKDAAEGGWGPRELDSGFERGGWAHEQQGKDGGVYEVVTEEKVVEMPVGSERFELSSGWEDQNPRDGHTGIRRQT